MMIREDILESYRKELTQAAKGISGKDLEWIRQKIISDSPGLDVAEDDSERESFILQDLIRLAKKIKKRKIKDIRGFITLEIRRQHYGHDISMVENQVARMKKVDMALLQSLDNELDEIEKKIAKEDPAYLDEIKGQISRARLWLKNKRTGRDVEFD